MIPVGSIVHLGDAEPRQDSEALEYRGVRLLARAKRAPVGWVGELMIRFTPDDLPVHISIQVPRFHADRKTAVREALLHGILRVDRGEVLAL